MERITYFGRLIKENPLVAFIILAVLAAAAYGFSGPSVPSSPIDPNSSGGSGSGGSGGAGGTGGSMNYTNFNTEFKSTYLDKSKAEICDRDKCFPCKSNDDCGEGNCVNFSDIIYSDPKFGRMRKACEGCKEYGFDKFCECPNVRPVYVPSPSPFYDPGNYYFQDFLSGTCIQTMDTTDITESNLIQPKCNLDTVLEDINDTHLLTNLSQPYLFQNEGDINLLEHYKFKNQYELNVPVHNAYIGVPYNYKEFVSQQSNILNYSCEGIPVNGGITLDNLDNNYYCKIGDIDKIQPISDVDDFNTWEEYDNYNLLNLNISSPNEERIRMGLPTEMGWNILYDVEGSPINNFNEFKANYKCIDDKDMIQKSSEAPRCLANNGIDLPIDCVESCTAPFEIPSSPSSVTISSGGEADFLQGLNSQTIQNSKLVTPDMKKLINYGDYYSINPNTQGISCSYNQDTMTNEYNWAPELRKIDTCATYKKSIGDNTAIEINNIDCESEVDCSAKCKPGELQCDSLSPNSYCDPNRQLLFSINDNTLNYGGLQSGNPPTKPEIGQECCTPNTFEDVYNRIPQVPGYITIKDVIDHYPGMINDIPPTLKQSTVDSNNPNTTFNEDASVTFGTRSFPLYYKNCETLHTGDEDLCGPQETFMEKAPLHATASEATREKCCINIDPITSATAGGNDQIFKGYYENIIIGSNQNPAYQIDNGVLVAENRCDLKNYNKPNNFITEGDISEIMNPINNIFDLRDYQASPFNFCYNSYPKDGDEVPIPSRDDMQHADSLKSEYKTSLLNQQTNPTGYLYQVYYDNPGKSVPESPYYTPGTTPALTNCTGGEMSFSPDACKVKYIQYKDKESNQILWRNEWGNEQDIFTPCDYPLKISSTATSVDTTITYDNDGFYTCADRQNNTKFYTGTENSIFKDEMCPNDSNYLVINPQSGANICSGYNNNKENCSNNLNCFYDINTNTCENLPRATCLQLRLPGRLNSGFNGYSKYTLYDGTQIINEENTAKDIEGIINNVGCTYIESGYYEPLHYGNIQLNQEQQLVSNNIKSIMNCNSDQDNPQNYTDNNNPFLDMENMRFNLKDLETEVVTEFKSKAIQTNQDQRLCKPGYFVDYAEDKDTNVFQCSPCPHVLIPHLNEDIKIDCIPNTEYYNNRSTNNLSVNAVIKEDPSDFYCEKYYLFNEANNQCQPVSCIIPEQYTKGIVTTNQLNTATYGGESLFQQEKPTGEVTFNYLEGGQDAMGGYLYSVPFKKPNSSHYCSADNIFLSDSCYEETISRSPPDSQDVYPNDVYTYDSSPCENLIDLTSYHTERQDCIDNNHIWVPKSGEPDMFGGSQVDGICIDLVDSKNDILFNALKENNFDFYNTDIKQPESFLTWLNENKDYINGILPQNPENFDNYVMPDDDQRPYIDRINAAIHDSNSSPNNIEQIKELTYREFNSDSGNWETVTKQFIPTSHTRPISTKPSTVETETPDDSQIVNTIIYKEYNSNNDNPKGYLYCIKTNGINSTKPICAWVYSTDINGLSDIERDDAADTIVDNIMDYFLFNDGNGHEIFINIMDLPTANNLRMYIDRIASTIRDGWVHSDGVSDDISFLMYNTSYTDIFAQAFLTFIDQTPDTINIHQTWGQVMTALGWNGAIPIQPTFKYARSQIEDPVVAATVIDLEEIFPLMGQRVDDGSLVSIRAQGLTDTAPADAKSNKLTHMKKIWFFDGEPGKYDISDIIPHTIHSPGDAVSPLSHLSKLYNLYDLVNRNATDANKSWNFLDQHSDAIFKPSLDDQSSLGMFNIGNRLYKVRATIDGNDYRNDIMDDHDLPISNFLNYDSSLEFKDSDGNTYDFIADKFGSNVDTRWIDHDDANPRVEDGIKYYGNIYNSHSETRMKFTNNPNTCGWVADLSSPEIKTAEKQDISNILSRKCNRLFYQGLEYDDEKYSSTIPLTLQSERYQTEINDNFEQNPFYSSIKDNSGVIDPYNDTTNKQVKSDLLPSFCSSKISTDNNFVACGFNKINNEFTDVKSALKTIKDPYLGYMETYDTENQWAQISTMSNTNPTADSLSVNKFEIQGNRLMGSNYGTQSTGDPNRPWYSSQELITEPATKENILEYTFCPENKVLTEINYPGNDNKKVCVSKLCHTDFNRSLTSDSMNSYKNSKFVNLKDNLNGTPGQPPQTFQRYTASPAQGISDEDIINAEIWPISRAQSYLNCEIINDQNSANKELIQNTGTVVSDITDYHFYEDTHDCSDFNKFILEKWYESIDSTVLEPNSIPNTLEPHSLEDKRKYFESIYNRESWVGGRTGASGKDPNEKYLDEGSISVYGFMLPQNWLYSNPPMDKIHWVANRQNLLRIFSEALKVLPPLGLCNVDPSVAAEAGYGLLNWQPDEELTSPATGGAQDESHNLFDIYGAGPVDSLPLINGGRTGVKTIKYQPKTNLQDKLPAAVVGYQEGVPPPAPSGGWKIQDFTGAFNLYGSNYKLTTLSYGATADNSVWLGSDDKGKGKLTPVPFSYKDYIQSSKMPADTELLAGSSTIDESRLVQSNEWDINSTKRIFTRNWRGDDIIDHSGDVISYCNYNEDCSTNKCIAYDQVDFGGYTFKNLCEPGDPGYTAKNADVRIGGHSGCFIYENFQSNSITGGGGAGAYKGICAAEQGSLCAQLNQKGATDANLLALNTRDKCGLSASVSGEWGGGLGPGMFATVAQKCHKDPISLIGDLFDKTPSGQFCKGNCQGDTDAKQAQVDAGYGNSLVGNLWKCDATA